MLNDMDGNLRSSGTTPPLSSMSQQTQPSSSTSSGTANASLYPQALPNNHDQHHHHSHHPHHQYGAFSSGFTGQMAAAVACSSSAYPSFFPSNYLTAWLI